MVDSGGLENRWAATSRGFESLTLRKNKSPITGPEITSDGRCEVAFYF